MNYDRSLAKARFYQHSCAYTSYLNVMRNNTDSFLVTGLYIQIIIMFKIDILYIFAYCLFI